MRKTWIIYIKVTVKINHSYFTQSLLQMEVTNKKLCYFVVWIPHGKFIDSVSFDESM